MKKVFSTVFFALAILFCSNASAQISHGGEPLFNQGIQRIKAPIVTLATLDNDKYLQEDLNQVKGASPLRVAIAQQCDIDVLAESKVTKDNNGTHYTLAINSPGATFVSFDFSVFELAEGATLFFYDQSGEFVLGSFNKSDVKDDGTFYTQAIPGSVAYIEYNVPLDTEPGKIILNEVSHGYKNIFQTISNIYDDAESQLKGSHGHAEGDCHINAVCPEGDDWRDQIRSVVAIEIKSSIGSFMCSGALINNTALDRTPYVLSAYHCQDEGEIGTLRGFVSYFLYQTNYCNGASGSGNKSVTGAQIKAKYSYSTGSDFLLLLLDSSVPDNYTPYYAGWDRNNVASPEPGVCIHHPGGDYKKLSFPRTISRLMGSYINFYQVNWYTGTANKGVTEQGSSGSPLFNASKRIIGQLYAGSSACDNMGGTDLYGRLYISWTGNNADNNSLRPWLDPENTGVSVLDGLNYTDNTGIDDVQTSRNKSLKVYPNPCKGTVRFDIDAIGDANYKVFDLNGHCVKEGRTILTSTVQGIDLSTLSKGSYILKIYTSANIYSATIVLL